MTPKPEQDLDGRRYTVGTVDRAIGLLKLLAELERPVSLPELVERTGENKATLYRLVRTLLDGGVVRRVQDQGYTLGPALISIGQAALRATGLTEATRPHMERLHEQFDETVVLSMLDGDEIVYLARLDTSHVLGVRGQVGARLPAYCTASGHALLAGLEDEEVRRILADSELESRAPHTLTTIDRIIERLAEIRAMGFAINDEELAVGHRAASVAVRDHADRPIAAMSISVPAARVSRESLEQFARQGLVPAGEALSVDLGGSPKGSGRPAEAVA